MPRHIYFGIIAAVLVAAALTVAIATSVATPHWAWIIVPIILAAGVRFWANR